MARPILKQAEQYASSPFIEAGWFGPKDWDDDPHDGEGSVQTIAYPQGHPLHAIPKDTDYFAPSDPYGVAMAHDTSSHPGQTKPYNPRDRGPIRNDTFNDEADYEVRGYAPWREQPDAQDPLPGMSDKGRKPTILTRGFNVNVNKLSPALRDRLVGDRMGRGQEGLFSPLDVDDQGPGSDFGSQLLQELRTNPGSVTPFKQHQGYQLGRHWSTNDETPRSFAGFGNGPNGMHMPVTVTAEWNGLGEDPANHGIPGEDEIMLRPGTKMKVHEVHIQHPVTGQEHDVSPEHPEEHVV